MQAIIFDFDGVLVDSYNFSRNIVKDVVHEVSEEEFKAHHDGNVYEKPIIPFDEKSTKEFFIKYFEGIHHQSPFLSLEEIRFLSSKCKLFIISSNREDIIAKFLSHHKLEYFDEVLGSNFHKSKIEKFKNLFNKYNLKPEECVFITDTLGDIKEGNKVGVKVIAVDFGFHERERLEKGNPYKIVSSFEEILKLLKEF